MRTMRWTKLPSYRPATRLKRRSSLRSKRFGQQIHFTTVQHRFCDFVFAEVIRRPGLVEAIQNDCGVMITGPANLAAMLNCLQMGFKTLAIEKRSSEVWSLLGMVKTEFTKFGDIMDATKKSIDAAASKFNEVGVRTRAIQKKLRDAEALSVPAVMVLTEGEVEVSANA